MNMTVSLDGIKEKIRHILSNDLDANVKTDHIQDDVSLYEDGLGLDSISIVNLILLLEQKFEISFEEDDLNYELFTSINKLSEVIASKVQ
jgi:acyl carrier protein